MLNFVEDTSLLVLAFLKIDRFMNINVNMDSFLRGKIVKFNGLFLCNFHGMMLLPTYPCCLIRQ